ncbi:MAG: cobaltochelatase subunit CobN [Thermoproteota archaeon]
MSIKIAFITNIPTDGLPFISAVKAINQRLDTEKVEAVLRTGGEFGDFGAADDFIRFAKESHVTVVRLMEEIPELDLLLSTLKRAGVPVFISSSVPGQKKDYQSLSTVNKKDYQTIAQYLHYGGKENFENLLLYLANQFASAHYQAEDPKPPVWEGIYHPDFESPPTLREYTSKKMVPGKPTVGIWFYQSQWQSQDISYLDALIQEIENQGANVLPVFFGGSEDEGVKGLEWIVENYFMNEGEPLVDVVISMLSFSISSSLKSASPPQVLKKLDVPVIKVILTCNSYEEWKHSPQGLSFIDIPMSVVMPEFDGLLVTVPIAAMDYSPTPSSMGNKVVHYDPIPERIRKVASLSINWAKLRHIPNHEKRVALIFHNYPPNNDTIGHAQGLDALQSVHKLLQELNRLGYKMDAPPEDAEKLTEVILQGLTNDRRWKSGNTLSQRAAAKISEPQYLRWYQELPLDVQRQMRDDWGEPPGEIFNYKHKLLIPGLVTGNVFIGLQPPRGFLENSSSIYHSPEISMPHHYYAYYHWIKKVFKADIIIHVGTHGSLEWLPGKSVGLSQTCFPDIAISDLPHVYIYTITNPGEGTQAKRRSYCCIIDHLIPVMHRAELYEDLAKLEVQLQEYYHTKVADQDKMEVAQNLIWDSAVEANLDRDLDITEEHALSHFDDFLEKLHHYLHELKDTQIRDGLHTLGTPPTNSQLDQFLVSLTRLSNGEVPSLRRSIAEMKGHNYDHLIENRGRRNPEGKTHGRIISEIHHLALELIQKFHEVNFNLQEIDHVMQQVLGGTDSDIRQCLKYISSFLVPALASTTDELTNTLSACDDHYIIPGPAGSITRGMADILPTGRNFYSIDPQAVPSQAAWQVGVDLGDSLLDRYLEEEGEYPDTLGIVVWATDTMKTKGDDIAEILYLMGVKPVWEETSGRVTGLEVIPAEELNRPRIDVTVRISGLFRDAFPNLVHLIDEAVELVSNLKESPRQNYILKHVEKEVRNLVAKGFDSETARKKAGYRIFGVRPGAHGCGISEAIDSKNWKDSTDLGNLYLKWGCYAYGKKEYGVSAPDQFKTRLSTIDVTVKNQDSREYDRLDSDDWYDSHGGLITAVKTLKGTAPRSFCGDSSDPNNVQNRSTQEETKFIFRSRLLNPKWIESLKPHGYSGAGELSRTVDFVFGWDATVEAVEDWMYDKLSDKYVLDPEMQEWLKEVNPYALQNMVERFLEAVKRDMWQATEEKLKELQKLYLSIEGLLEGVEE